MQVRFAKMINGVAFKMGTRYDLISVPAIGQQIVWEDDEDYVVENVAWDLGKVASAAVVVLKELDVPRI